jgi:hypothetical protein
MNNLNRATYTLFVSRYVDGMMRSFTNRRMNHILEHPRDTQALQRFAGDFAHERERLMHVEGLTFKHKGSMLGSPKQVREQEEQTIGGLLATAQDASANRVILGNQ